ncbi:MAG TPA: hypothetical protein VGD41_05135 [Pyrinomonadaceae bacterium]
MPEIRDYYIHVRDLDIPALHNRRNELLASGQGSFASLPDESLAELLAVTRELRKRAAIAPKRTTAPKKSRESKDDLESII